MAFLDVMAAAEAVANLIKRTIDLFDPDPERSRQKRLEKAQAKLRAIEKEIREILREMDIASRNH